MVVKYFGNKIVILFGFFFQHKIFLSRYRYVPMRTAKHQYNISLLAIWNRFICLFISLREVTITLMCSCPHKRRLYHLIHTFYFFLSAVFLQDMGDIVTLQASISFNSYQRFSICHHSHLRPTLHSNKHVTTLPFLFPFRLRCFPK